MGTQGHNGCDDNANSIPKSLGVRRLRLRPAAAPKTPMPGRGPLGLRKDIVRREVSPPIHATFTAGSYGRSGHGAGRVCVATTTPETLLSQSEILR
jgi:hypothetical protein